MDTASATPAEIGLRYISYPDTCCRGETNGGANRRGCDFLAERRQPSGRGFNYEGMLIRSSTGRLAPCRYLVLYRGLAASFAFLKT